MTQAAGGAMGHHGPDDYADCTTPSHWERPAKEGEPAMPSPQTNATGQFSPSRYEPNPIDDRAVANTPLGGTYLALATAIEAVTDDIPNEVFASLDPSTRKSIRHAEAALRRAAFSVVLHAPEKKEV